MKKEEKQKKKRGFAAMSPELRAEIASKGGKAAHAQGKAHKWNSKTASAAGKKGGKNSRGGGRPIK